MNESPNTIIESLKLIFDFLSNNLGYLTFIILIIICRDAISNFISRITSFSYDNGESKIGVNAASPSEQKNIKEEHPSTDKIQTYKAIAHEKIDDSKKEEQDNISKMFDEFENGNYEDAEKTFKAHALEETDEIKLQQDKALFLFLKYTKAQDNSALEQLKSLAKEVKSEDSKFEILKWLSYSLSEAMQYEKVIELWHKHLSLLTSDKLKNRALINLAAALNTNQQSADAKTILLEHLAKEKNELHKSEIYNALSKTETSLGNKLLSVYCKDKCVELDANNKKYLFDSAYAAGNENINAISISNYIRLTNISSDNSMVLNNLGAKAQDAGLSICAIENYIKSSSLNNTLAMANQGYLLLHAGFAEEAELIANNALKLENPHKNVHKLISAINDKKEQQNKEWDKLKEKSRDKQKALRMYTEQLYLGDSKLLIGDWFVNGAHPVNIKPENDNITIRWVEHINSNTYDMKLTGKIAGSTFEGELKKQKNDTKINSLLGLAENYNKPCFGYISEDESLLLFKPTKLEDDIPLFFKRMKNEHE